MTVRSSTGITKRRTILLSGIIGTCAVLVFLSNLGCYKPYGSREPAIFLMDSALRTYAEEHSGRFPSGGDQFSALAQLYPEYCCPGRELAGLSGDIQKTTNALQHGRSISNFTSWVYVPGLRLDDDPKLAILWESKPARLKLFGKSLGLTRPALLLSREITNVPASQWPEFLKYQGDVLAATLAKRSSVINAEHNTIKAPGSTTKPRASEKQ